MRRERSMKRQRHSILVEDGAPVPGTLALGHKSAQAHRGWLQGWGALGGLWVPFFWSSLKPSSRKPSLIMQECVKRAMASAELLMSDVESSFWWVGRASAMPCRTFCGLRGLDTISLFVWVPIESGHKKQSDEVE